MKILFELVISLFLLFDLYGIFSIIASTQLDNRYTKVYDDFILFVHLDLSLKNSIRYPIHLILRRKYDIKYKYLYLTNKINCHNIFEPSYDELTILKKELNKIERIIKLKKLKI